MSADALNAMRWDGTSAHYEVWYLSFTDRGTGTGFWIRSTFRKPPGEAGTASLWFMAMVPGEEPVGLKHDVPLPELVHSADPFRLEIAGAVLDGTSYRGGFGEVSWDLRWERGAPPARHVAPSLEKAKIAKTVLVLPQPDVLVEGTVTLPGGQVVELEGARGGQAHLWGRKHANRWCWMHCNDLEDEAGGFVPGYVDAVSVVVPRFGREIGPSTPVVAMIDGQPLHSTSPRRVFGNDATISLETYTFTAKGRRPIVATVRARREELVGVTYHDPDGDLVYCYNGETADLELTADGRRLLAPGRCHFEYAQRTPIDGAPIHIT